ncbi:hypothetical protein KFU94_13410 [Chloroflexi bacterium TSY]|nr:hypothetical protein [Chloroflexi bacterium TSY]
MGTYNYEKVLLDYEKGHMDVEMAMGHSLQHIGKLHEGQNHAASEHQVLQKRMNTLEELVQGMQKGLTALNQTASKLKAEFDGSITQIETPTSTKKQMKKPPKQS